MYSTSFSNFYLIPPEDAARLEPKELKAPANDKDVERFEAILSGDGAYKPKSLELVMPATDSNAVQRMGSNILDRITDLKQSVDDRNARVGELFKESDGLSMQNALKVQWELTMFSVESTLMTTSASKAGEGIKTLFKNQ